MDLQNHSPPLNGPNDCSSAVISPQAECSSPNRENADPRPAAAIARHISLQSHPVVAAPSRDSRASTALSAALCLMLSSESADVHDAGRAVYSEHSGADMRAATGVGLSPVPESEASAASRDPLRAGSASSPALTYSPDTQSRTYNVSASGAARDMMLASVSGMLPTPGEDHVAAPSPALPLDSVRPDAHVSRSRPHTPPAGSSARTAASQPRGRSAATRRSASSSWREVGDSTFAHPAAPASAPWAAPKGHETRSTSRRHTMLVQPGVSLPSYMRPTFQSRVAKHSQAPQHRPGTAPADSPPRAYRGRLGEEIGARVGRNQSTAAAAWSARPSTAGTAAQRRLSLPARRAYEAFGHRSVGPVTPAKAPKTPNGEAVADSNAANRRRLRPFKAGKVPTNVLGVTEWSAVAGANGQFALQASSSLGGSSTDMPAEPLREEQTIGTVGAIRC
jgi:hypothetical protein